MTASPKAQLEESKVKATKRIRAVIKARRQSIAFAAPELQNEKWAELEAQILAAVAEIKT